MLNNLGGILLKNRSIDKARFDAFLADFDLQNELTEHCILLQDDKGENDFFDGYKYRNGVASFANVSINKSENIVKIIRSPIGGRPIYYMDNEEFFAFSSTLKSLSKIVDFDFDQRMIFSLLVEGRQEHQSHTLIQDVKELTPGSSIEVNYSQSKVDFYIAEDSNEGRENFNGSYEEATLKIRDLLSQSFQKLDEGRVGSLLSGGIDSSVISGLLYSWNPGVELFTAHYGDAGYSEKHWAFIMVNHLSSSHHHEVIPNLHGFRNDLEEMHRTIELPSFSVGTYNQFCLTKAAKERGITKLYDGTGADALFGGHSHHQALLWVETLRKFSIIEVFKSELSGSTAKKLRLLSKTYLEHFIKNKCPKWLISYFYYKYYEDVKYLNRDFLVRGFREWLEIEESRLDLNQHLYKSYYHGEAKHLMRYMEKCCRANDIELHTPFMDNVELASFAHNLPSEWKLKNGVTKSLLRDSCKDLLPAEIYARQDKMGLVGPTNAWISEMKEDFVDYFDNRLADIYDIEKIKKEYRNWWNVKDKIENYRLYKHLSFAVWAKVWQVK